MEDFSRYFALKFEICKNYANELHAFRNEIFLWQFVGIVVPYHGDKNWTISLKTLGLRKIEVFVGLSFLKAVFRRVLREAMFKGQYLRNAAGCGHKIFHEGKMSYREL